MQVDSGREPHPAAPDASGCVDPAGAGGHARPGKGFREKHSFGDDATTFHNRFCQAGVGLRNGSLYYGYFRYDETS